MKNVLTNKTNPTLLILEERLFKYKECNDYHHLNKKYCEILEKKMVIIPVIQSDMVISKIKC